MAYDAPFVRLTFGGTTSTEDEWANTLTLGSPETGVSQASFDAINPQAFDTAARAFYVASGGMASYNQLSYIKVAYIGTDGKYIDDPKIYDLPTPVNGVSNYGIPPQDSIVVSHLTEARRGLAYRGRSYLPAGFADASTNGKLSTSSVSTLSTRTKTFYDSINSTVETATGLPINLVVNSNVREGYTRYVTAISIGNLIDTQRRRRNRLSEQYVDTALA